MAMTSTKSLTAVRTTRLPSGQAVPVLGLGTWRMGEKRARRRDEIAALQLGIELGMTLIDTAEMYADGGAETVVGKAIADRRDDVFLVSKVLPRHASRRGTVQACEHSLKRLGTTHLDLYLLHWRADTPLEETIGAFETLREAGKIRHWGVSNFDIPDLEEVWGLPAGARCATDQVLYNLTRRGIEGDLLPLCAEHAMPIMAYSPIEQGQLLDNPVLQELARRRGATPGQLALAWVMRRDGILAIPKTATLAHVRENRAALDLHLSMDDLDTLDRAFPRPKGPRPLETL
jgi:diketogulonate reductase-like aldo/keto reductase